MKIRQVAISFLLVGTSAELEDDLERYDGLTKPFESTLNLFCTKVPNLKECAENLFDSMKACSEPEERKNVDSFYRASARALDFICDNKEKIAEALITSSQDQCTVRQLQALDGCLQHIFPADDENAASLRADIEAIHYSILSVEKECRDLEGVKKCILEELSVCDNRISAKLVTSMFQSINNELPCGKFDLSPASPVSVVSIALLTAALAVSL